MHDTYCQFTVIFFIIPKLLYFSFHINIPGIILSSSVTAISTGQLETPMTLLINVFIQEVVYAVPSALQHPLHYNLPKKSSLKILYEHNYLSQICGLIQF